jgi:hypothetical protein
MPDSPVAGMASRLRFGPATCWASSCRRLNKKNRPRRPSVQSGKRFMPLGVISPHDLGQAGGVRFQIVCRYPPRVRKYSCQSEQNRLV